MNLTEMNELIETFKNNIPVGKTKSVIMKTCLNIRNIIINFQFTDSLIHDYTECESKFYGCIRDEWAEEIAFYTIDDPHEAFDELFYEFKYAAHRIIAAVERSTDKNTCDNSDRNECMIKT